MTTRRLLVLAHSMPGAPDGGYAIIEIEMLFAIGKRATECPARMIECGDASRVAGSCIR